MLQRRRYGGGQPHADAAERSARASEGRLQLVLVRVRCVSCARAQEQYHRSDTLLPSRIDDRRQAARLNDRESSCVCKDCG